MASRVLRILLMLGLAAAAGVAGWQVWQLEQVRAAQRGDSARLDGITLRATRAMLDIRAAQRAYLSPGQGIGFWKPRVDQHLLALRDDLQSLKTGTLSPSSSALAADDAALDALGEVMRLERRIAEHVQAGRLEHAADLVYADNIRANLALDQAIDGAMTAHRLELQAAQADMRWREGAILALMGLFGFLFALVVMPSRAPGEGQADALESTAGGTEGTAGRASEERPEERRSAAAAAGLRTSDARGGTALLGLNQTAPLRSTGGDKSAVAPASATAVAAPVAARSATAAARSAARASAAPVAPAARALSDDRRSSQTQHQSDAAGATMLAAAADLCASMATVGDAEGLRPLLARLSDQLDAVGVIVWLQDVDGRTLTPALTHGYPAETLAHLRAIDRNADNATARAFRTGETQTVAGQGARAAGQGERGALVVPMQTATGCVGVIAAEVRHGREHDPATLALTRIIAAQLAMLTATPGPATAG